MLSVVFGPASSSRVDGAVCHVRGSPSEGNVVHSSLVEALSRLFSHAHGSLFRLSHTHTSLHISSPTDLCMPHASLEELPSMCGTEQLETPVVGISHQSCEEDYFKGAELW